MNTEIFTKSLLLACVLALTAGCAHKQGAPVRDSKPKVSARTPATKPPPPSVARVGEHIVRQGETLYAISRLYGVSVPNLIAWNNLVRPEQLEVGKVLRIAAAAEAETVPVTPQSVPAEAVPEPLVVKREPRGGKEAYSDEAWARIQSGGSAPAPATTPSPSTTQPADAASIKGGWIWPVKGTIIGRFDEPSGEDAKLRNRGIDIAGKPGTPIVAAADGKVAYAGSGLVGYGKLVIIKHNDEYLTAYAHNRLILVRVDDKVTKGQKIAELGDTGTDQPKLHFELRKQGQPVDPLKYLPTQ